MSDTAPVSRSTAVEALLRRDRLLVIGALIAASLACLAWIVPMARDMYGPMNGAAAWMTAGTRGAAYGALLFAMWAVMMAGMMLPAAAPTILLFAVVVRSHDGTHVQARTSALTAGYLAVWTAFSLAAALVQELLAAQLYLSPMMQLRSRTLSGAVLLLAGAYQLTPVKRACLRSCRAPAAFIARHYRPGNGAAFRMGLLHGRYCLGCCWALMLLLFMAGVMNLIAIIAITVFVLLEKTAPFGAHGTRLSGLLLLGCGVLMLMLAQ